MILFFTYRSCLTSVLVILLFAKNVCKDNHIFSLIQVFSGFSNFSFAFCSFIRIFAEISIYVR